MKDARQVIASGVSAQEVFAPPHRCAPVLRLGERPACDAPRRGINFSAHRKSSPYLEKRRGAWQREGGFAFTGGVRSMSSELKKEGEALPLVAIVGRPNVGKST